MPPTRLLIEPCEADDPRRGDWVRSVAESLSPNPQVAADGVARLQRLGFVVVDGGTSGDARGGRVPPAGGSLGTLGLLTAAVCVSGAVSLAVRRPPRRPGRGGEICAEITLAGEPCKNPKRSCRAPHRPQTAKQRRRSHRMRAVGEASNLNLAVAGTVNAQGALKRLKKAELLSRPDSDVRYKRPTPQQIAALVAANQDGFTVSPRHVADRGKDAKTGVCVALDYTALKWDAATQGAAFDPNGNPTPDMVEEINEWLQSCEPALRGGNCWIGGWSDPATNELELNLTAVFRSAYRSEAETFGALQGQIEVFDIDIANAGLAGGIRVSRGGETSWSAERAQRPALWRRLLRV